MLMRCNPIRTVYKAKSILNRQKMRIVTNLVDSLKYLYLMVFLGQILLWKGRSLLLHSTEQRECNTSPTHSLSSLVTFPLHSFFLKKQQMLASPWRWATKPFWNTAVRNPTIRKNINRLKAKNYVMISINAKKHCWNTKSIPFFKIFFQQASNGKKFY